MRNLILLFIRNGGALVFLGLEVLCFFLIIQFNEPQGTIYFSSLNNANGWIDEKTADAQDFLKLREISDSLAAENATLYEQLRSQRTEDTPDSIPDFSLVDSGYTYIPARVIKNSINRANNYIRLNKGRNDGVEPNMGVISQGGIVGIVVDVSSNYSLVMSFLHQQTRISASIAGTGFFGSLTWPGGSPREALLLDVPKHAQLTKGDLIETSGYTMLFPPEMTIGKIKSFEVGEGSSSYDIEVRLDNDLSNLKYAYVVVVPDREEQKQLEEELRNE
ncbi:MAG: rod shape-determining protein MreC [Bacteroidetes bacterium]|nr:rod shape-determining protein MreC [Bacteroidota bacterium]